MSAPTPVVGQGDTVRLRDGTEIVVRHTYDSYTDVSGEHEGPFVAGADYRERHLLADVAEVVACNAHRCEICGGGVTSANPEEYPYCESCHYTGAVAERQREEQLYRFRAAFPDGTADVEHTGGGCFWLAVRFGEGDYYVLTDGEASLPEQANGGWRYLGLHSDDEKSPHYEGTEIRYLAEGSDDALSDEAAIRDIRRHRKGQRPFPRRGESRISGHAAAGVPFEQATAYRLTVPAALARRIGPDVLFRVEATEEGLLYRIVEGAPPPAAAGPPPSWLR